MSQDDSCLKMDYPEAPGVSASGEPAVRAVPQEPPLVEARNLSVSYRGRNALRDVNLDIRAGRITALIGPSGCGKTSFLSCLNRMTDLIPGCEVSGSVRIAGLDVSSPGTDVMSVRRWVGMIFQKPNPFPMSIRENLHLPLREHGQRDRRMRDDLAEQVLREVGLWDEVRDRLDSSALGLSGGQKQRLCIARALTLRPQLLLMDEPCSALDPIAMETIEQAIRKMRGQYTLVIVTHNLAQARRLADDVGVFWVRNGVGQLVEFGPTDDVFDRTRDPDVSAYVHGQRG
jgi:phosphate transport system ATP-binding protein